MPSQSLISDHAAGIAMEVLEVFAPLLREEEKKDAFKEIYDRVSAGIALYEMKAERMNKRLHPIPSKN